MSKWRYLAIYASAFIFIFVGVWIANDFFIGVPIHSAVMALIVATLFMAFIGYQHLNKKNYRQNREHGSARWGRPADARNYADPKPENNIILTQTESLTMNSRPKPVKFARNKNILIIGGSGSGKTRFYVKPNIMQACESKQYPISVVTTDPKGSILEECGQMLIEKGYTIKVINTIDFGKSMKYNPFAYIRSEKDILKFVTTLISNTKGEGKDSGEDFWVKAEKMLYQALVGYIWYEYDPEHQTMNTLVSMINQMEVREEDETFKNPIDILFEELESKDEEHFAVRQYKKYKLAAGKTAKSILISCGARLAPFDIKEVREMMSVDELELDKLGGFKRRVRNKKTGEYEDKVIKRKTALFVIISDTDASFNFIVSLMYSQLFNLLCDKADNEFRGRLPVHVRCLLDEFANIGLIPNFEKLIATIRSREISVSVILQAESQLKAVYKDNTDTIIGNCDTQLFLGGKEKTTLESISKMLGKETIDSYNTSKSGGSQKSNSTSYQKMGRELMSMDEIAVMDGSMCILQIRGERPFLSKKYDIEGHKNYKLLSDYDPSRHLDVKEFLSTDIKNKDLKKGTVYVFDNKILNGAAKQQAAKQKNKTKKGD